jgi:tetratricopeptide (TPR) repeat protein
MENAWGSVTDTTKVGTKSLVEAGVITVPTEPVSAAAWIRRVLITGIVIGVAVLGYVYARNAQLASQLKHEREQALDSFDKVKKKMPRNWAAPFHLALGETYVREEKPEEAKNAFLKAFAPFIAVAGAKGQSPPTLEEELFLIDLALAHIALGGDKDPGIQKDQIINKKRLEWGEVKESMLRPLKAIKSHEGTLLALRKLSLKLLELDQKGLAMGLAIDIAAAGGILQAEQVALLLESGKTKEANETVQPPPTAPDALMPAGATRMAYAVGYAYQKDFDKARAVAMWIGPPWEQFQAVLAVAEVALARGKETAAKECLEEAKKLARGELQKYPTKVSPIWMVELVSLCAHTGDIDEAETWIKKITDPACKARAKLEVLRLQAAKTKSLDPAQLDHTKCAAYALAVLEEARLKTKKNASPAKVIEAAREQDELLRPLIYIGAALGTQDQ